MKIQNYTKTNEFLTANNITTPQEQTTDNHLRLLEKIQQIKEIFLEQNIKPTGYNKFQKYKYFCLDDIVPYIITFCNKLRLATMFELEPPVGKLHIIDLETGETETWSTIMPEANHEKPTERCKEIQSIQTYTRRSLYLQCLDIVDANIIEIENGKKSQKPKHNNKSKHDPYETKNEPQQTLQTSQKHTEPESKHLSFYINKIKNMLETENMEGTPEQIKTCAEKLVSKDSIMYPYILESFNAR